MISVRGPWASMKFDGTHVTVRRPLGLDVIPVSQVAAVHRDAARCVLTVTDSGGVRHSIRYWTVAGAAKRFQQAVTAAAHRAPYQFQRLPGDGGWASGGCATPGAYGIPQAQRYTGEQFPFGPRR